MRRLGLNPLVLLLAVMAGICAGAGGYTFYFAEGLSYLSNDPKACVNCHIMNEQYDGWIKASHHAFATCNSCHVPHDLVGKYLTKIEHGYRHSRGFTLQDFHEPIRITESSLKIVEHNCIGCHEDLVEPLTAHAAGDVGCVHCHADVGHGPKQ
ncbi:MAG: cytochrome c nitrite reductase small subunit [Planctomycetes bacterium]|nr:cytochrome c nitrite reductase small subunit [Planctomycetota bacterium]